MGGVKCISYPCSKDTDSQFCTGQKDTLTDHEMKQILEKRVQVAKGSRTEKAVLSTLDAKPYPEHIRRWSSGPILELFSAILSAICLVILLWQWTKGSANVRLTQEVLLYTNHISLTDAMHQLRSEYNAWCNTHNRMDLEVPTWDPKNVDRSSWDLTFQDPKKNIAAGTLQGISTSIDIHYTTIDLFYVSLPIFVLSFLFQFERFRNYCTLDNLEGWYKPWLGPEFSRWVEYLCTSPLQIFIVSVAFGTTNITTILGQCGMQAALVLFGYDIEKQIKKIYNRNDIDFRAQDFYTKVNESNIYNANHAEEPFIYKQNKYQFAKKKRFHHVLWNRSDLRLWVYLGVSWFLHALIWFGILFRFYEQEHQGQVCEKNENFRMPSAVSFLVWSQFVLFTSFGVVSTLQVLNAKPLPKQDFTEFGGKVDQKKAWNNVSFRYSILSITAKTLLEVGFVWVVSMYKPFPVAPIATIERGFMMNHVNQTCSAVLVPKL
jgi:hypothetical protein